MKLLSDRSRSVMQFASREARALGHSSIETEHVLLGILKEGSALTETVRRKIDHDFNKIRLELATHILNRTGNITTYRLPLGHDVETVLKSAEAQASISSSDSIIPEHLLVALINTPNTAAYRTLAALNIQADDVLLDLAADRG